MGPPHVIPFDGAEKPGSVDAGDAEIDGFEQRVLEGGVGEDRQRIARDVAIMIGAVHRVLQRAVAVHQLLGIAEVVFRLVALFQSALPEVPFLRRTAAVGEHHGQRDLALAEIIADTLAELLGGAGIIERVIDQLEGDAANLIGIR